MSKLEINKSESSFPELWGEGLVEGRDYYLIGSHHNDAGELVWKRDPANPYVATMTPEERIKRAMSYVERYGGIDGDHHKQWLITQMTMALLGSEEEWTKWELEMRGEYDEENEEYEYGEWDEGIPP